MLNSEPDSRIKGLRGWETGDGRREPGDGGRETGVGRRGSGEEEVEEKEEVEEVEEVEEEEEEEGGLKTSKRSCQRLPLTPFSFFQSKQFRFNSIRDRLVL